MIEKPCISKGCAAEGIFGYGSLLKGSMRWACSKHRGLLPSQGTSSGLRPPSPYAMEKGEVVPSPALLEKVPDRADEVPSPRQGRLFG